MSENLETQIVDAFISKQGVYIAVHQPKADVYELYMVIHEFGVELLGDTSCGIPDKLPDEVKDWFWST